MRIYAEPFDYSVPQWEPYDADRLAAIGAPETAVAALTGRGLPEDLFSQFVRDPERELEETELPECGKAVFLGQHYDGYNNTYWLSLADGSVWMRYGGYDEPLDHVKKINTSVEALQAMLAVFREYVVDEPESDDLDENLAHVHQVVMHAFAADPSTFEDDENWWSITFFEIGFSIARPMRGDDLLYQLVSRDEDGRWYLDHPGYEDEDE